MAYNPYDDLKSIRDYKSNYTKAQSANDTVGMQNAQNAAKSHYQSLRDNGYSTYADQMAGFTLQQADDFINNYNAPTAKVTQSGVPKLAADAGTKLFNAAKNAADTVSSAYTDITPDILNWVTGIYDNKVLYDNARYTDGSGNYQQYADAAQPYYQNLVNAGRNDIAKLLGASDTETALNYLRGIGINLDSSAQDMNSIMTGLLTQPSQSLDMGAVWEQSQPILDYINGITQPDEATQAANQQAINNMNMLMTDILGGNQQLKQDSDRLNDLIAQYMGEQTGRYEDLYNWIKNENFYDTETAKNIMSYYNAQGSDAANEATAEGIAGNAGNIDSYAAANALRQQLDFTNAGNAAVLNQYNSQVGNMLETLKALGVDVGDAQDRMLDLYGANQAYNAELLGGYNTGVDTVLGAMNSTAQNSNAAAVDTLNSLLGLYEAGMNNDTNRYLGQLETAGGLLANRDSLASAERQLSATNAANLEALNAELASNERISANELAQAMQLAGIDRELSIAELENAYRIASEGNASNERISANELAAALQQASINSDTNKYIADLEASSNKYAVDAEKDIANAQLEAEKAATAATPTGFDEILDVFFAARPDTLAANSMATEDYVDALTMQRLADAFGWDKTTFDAILEELTNYKDNVIAGLTKDSRANGIWAMPNTAN